jgi:hypothetical protein
MTGRIRTSTEAHEASALDHMRGLTRAEPCDPGAPPTVEQTPLPDDLIGDDPAGKSPARWAHDRILLYLAHFESQLDAEQEVALGFAGSDAGVLRIEGIGYFDPDILTFYGFDEDGARTQLIQHVSQLNVMLTAVPKGGSDDEPARRFGFRPGGNGAD